ncbi:MAG TPA: hypothetical protein VHE53_02570 [Patescibacteria group bacterium]|nr:hypothetical protein [Patescibacteria group bacterium]
MIGPNEIRIIASDAWTRRDGSGRPGYYWRELAGSKLGDAIKVLKGLKLIDDNDKLALPVYITGPYSLNGTIVKNAEHSKIILKPGDVLRG